MGQGRAGIPGCELDLAEKQEQEAFTLEPPPSGSHSGKGPRAQERVKGQQQRPRAEKAQLGDRAGSHTG